MLLLIKLLLAHLLGDFVCQPHRWVEQKELKKYKAWQLYVHVVIHGLLITILVHDKNFWIPTLIIVFSHLLVDTMKLMFQKDTNRRWWFMIDQALHLAVIFAVWYYEETPTINVEVINTPNFLLLVTVIVFITTPASIIIKTFISQWTPDLWPANNTNQHAIPANIVQNSSQLSTSSLQNAGKIIGILERLFVFAFVLTNNWDAIGFLIAAKSVFRFGDLKESKDLKLTEYVLIGTLLSFGLAIAAGLVITNFGSSDIEKVDLFKLLNEVRL